MGASFRENKVDQILYS